MTWSADIYERGGGVSEDDISPLRYSLPDGRVIDTQMASSVPVSKKRFVERRHEVFRLYEQLYTSDVVTITLGMTETWFDQVSGKWIDFAPTTKDMLSSNSRFLFVNQTFAENVAHSLFELLIESIGSTRRLNLF